MSKKNIRFEFWTSSEGNQEVHYFNAENDEYFFGYNPLLIPEEKVTELKEWIRDNL